MNTFFIIVTWTVFTMLVAGSIQPKWLKLESRKKVFKYYVPSLFGAILLGSIMTPSATPTSTNSTASTTNQVNKMSENIPVKQEQKIETPIIPEKKDYKIVYEITNKRYDGGKNYYVLLENINLKDSSFKNKIKEVINEIVKSKGEKISIDFFNDPKMLDLQYKLYGDNSLGRVLTSDENDKLGQHYIAGFSGQLDADIYKNTIHFFPGKFTTDKNFGKYVETIEYNPNIK